MVNFYRLRAKWTRSERKWKAPLARPLSPRTDDTKVTAPQYFMAHAHVARLWTEREERGLEWFLKSLRGLLPEPKKAEVKNYTLHHIHLERPQYLMALEVLTTRLGVRI